MTMARSSGLPVGGVQAARRPYPKPAGPESTARAAPVIVLTSACSGADWLLSLLDRYPDLSCTSGTGILPLCEQAAAVWRKADGQADGPLSALGAASTRALASGIITSVLAREGKRRWCEAATAPPRTAETFLQLYPGTSVLCLHRAYPEVVRAIIRASPWGIVGGAFAPFISAHPASTVAALAGYWATQTGDLLAFERAHPQACLRVRYEDLATAPDDTLGKIASFAGIGGIGHQAAPSAEHGTVAAAEPGNPAPQVPLPTDQIPPALLTRVNDLLLQLDYPPLR
jgi:hypothetical protein